MPTVLVVDDSAIDRKLVSGLLKDLSHWTVELAENGSQALDKMRESPADVVVTDLQMPQMDGLELVSAIRVQFANVPVILMTANGSEALAIEALEQGAAGYVPKSRLAQSLADTIESVLGMVHADRSYEQLIECLTRTEFSFSLTNDPALIDPLVDLMQQMIEGVRLCGHIERVRVGVALEQALLNAMYRGNLEISYDTMQEARERLMRGEADPVEARSAEAPYANRKVFFDANISPSEARFVVRDEGPGFDTKLVPAAGDAKALEREGGRGLILMRTFLDEVSFNERGNEVTLVKRRTAAGS